jgi:diguanylate cyclase (GGDEF)-like protein/PAS domain S-box-containing protein
MSVLLVDGDAGVRSRVRTQLQDQGVHVTVAATVAEAEAALVVGRYVVLIVELSLPDGSGLEVLDHLRAAGSTSHVIIVSSSTADADRVRALERGADDFVVKPLYLRELSARVLGVRRHRDPIADTMLRIGRFAIDLTSREVSCAGTKVAMTVKEFDLLAYLAARPGHVFGREQLLRAVWSPAPERLQVARVTEQIRGLRNILEVDPAHPEILVTVRGAGYRLDLPTADAQVGQVASALERGEIIHIDGLIVSCDQAAADLVGAAAPDALVSQQLIEFVAPASLAAARERLIETGAGPARRSQLIDFRQGDTGEVTAAVESTPAIWRAQPARRLRLTAVPDARARLRGLVVGVLGDLSDAIVITDLHFHIRSWNSAAERLYGWMEDEVQGRHVLDVLHWVSDSEQIPEMWQHLEHTGRWHGESTQLARDGSVVEILSSTTLVRDGAGDPVGIVSVNRAAVDARRAQSLEQAATFASRLQQGLADDEFQVFYQPVVDLDDGRLITLEALVRWEHPERGTLLPGEFLDAAERSGLIIELGDRVLDMACRQAADWRRSGADINLSVNVSARQLAAPGMVQRFTSIVRDSGFDPAYLWLEVTETAVVEELEKVSQVLHRMVEFGVGVAIDDFGTGWASLTYLRTFPVHALKIDRSFVAKAGHAASDTAIIRSVLALGAELDLFVVAEGVETQAQRKALKRLGCSFGQGYHFGRPTAAGDVPVERAQRISVEAQVPGAVLTTALSTGAPDLRRHGLSMVAVTPSPHRRPRPAPSPYGPGRLTNVNAGESDVVADLLRGLLRVRSAPAAVDLLHRTIRSMGGTPVPATEADEQALPVDVSLGEGPPVLVEVEQFTIARMQLERLLPRLVEDARQAVDLLRQTERLVEETARDELTGLANRRVLDRVLPRTRSGSVVMIDLDHFKDVNDRHGHAAGDAVLVSFGKVLRAQARAQDTSCRIGGEEFALVLTDAGVSGAVKLVDRIRKAWSSAAPQAVTFSAGIAAVDTHGGMAALVAADQALYEAKALGRDRTELAGTLVDR